MTKEISKVQKKPVSDKEMHSVCNKNVLELDSGPRFGCRHVQAIVLNLGMTVFIATRVNLSVAIVAMTDKTASPNPDVPTYNWKNTSIILSSYFWGYICLQILAGYLGKTYGPKYFLFMATLVNFCACALTPLAAQHFESTGVIACRIIQGLSQGFLFPSAHVILGRWAPQEERSTLNNIIFSGMPLGHIMGSLITGYVSATWWGWPASFYILAGLGLCWSVLWLLLGRNSPVEHPRITFAEKSYIQVSLKQEDNLNLPVPWKNIFTCIPFYILIITYIGNSWGLAILMTETPTYMANIMNFKIKQNALVNAIPTAAIFFGSLLVGSVSDWLISRNFLSVVYARKVFQSIGNYGQALCLIVLSFLTSSQSIIAVVILTIGSLFHSCINSASNINHLDLSPRFSGIVYGILGTIGQGASIVGPLSANWILTDLTSVSQWQMVFTIAAAFFIAGGTAFLLFASATRQSWDGPEDSKHEEKVKRGSIISLRCV